MPCREAVRVLDMGCGDGHLLARLACRQPAGLQLIGIDISRSELAQGARQLGARATLGCARAQALPLRAASVEHVLSHMALMLMDESTKVLAELQRVLVPGDGFAAIVGARVSNCQVSETFLDVLRPFVSSLAWQPLRLGDRRWWDEAGIRDLLAGFDEVRIVTAIVERRVTPALAWEWLAETYDPVRLADAERVTLKARFLTAARARVDDDGCIEQRIGLRRIMARAPAISG